MSILWNLFEIGINCFQGFIMMYFPFKFLGGKFSSRFVQNHGLLFSALYTALISLLNLITIFESFLAFLYVALILLYCITCLNGKFLNKLFASTFPVVIGLIISALTSSGTAFLFNKSINDIFVSHSIVRIVSVSVTQLIILYLIMLSLKVFQRDHPGSNRLSHNEWLLIIISLILSIIIGALLVMISVDINSDKSRLFTLIGITAIIVMNIVSFYFIIDLGKKNIAVIENEKLKIQIAYNEQYIENANTEYNLIQKIRHDNKAMYQVLSDLLNKRDYDNAYEYLKKMMNIADNKIIFVNTNNIFVNSIINAKLAIAKSFNIHVSCITINQFNGIDDIDLCRLLSNMLDNAITATSELDLPDKSVSISISEDIGTYTFLVCNTIKESVLQVNPKLFSTKKNKEVSGLGTKIICDIAEKYNGRCDFYEKEGLFCCSVILNRQ